MWTYCEKDQAKAEIKGQTVEPDSEIEPWHLVDCSSWIFIMLVEHKKRQVSNNPFCIITMIRKRLSRAKQRSRSYSCHIAHISCSCGQEVFKRRPNSWKVRQWLHRCQSTARILREGMCQTMMASSLWDLRCAGVRVCICWHLLTRIKRWWSGLRWCVRMVAL
jgi:hypothetical protein